MGGGYCPVVVAKWSEHWELKPGVLGFNSQQVPAFLFYFITLVFTAKYYTSSLIHTANNKHANISDRNLLKWNDKNPFNDC